MWAALVALLVENFVPILVTILQKGLETALKGAFLAALAYVLWKWGFRIEARVWSLVMSWFNANGLPSIDLPEIGGWLTANGFWGYFASADAWIPLREFLIAVGVYCHILLI
jgi:hypothetical protein